MMVLLALSILWTLTVAGLLARAIGQYRHFRVLKAEPDDGAPKAAVTVIVPARNEERTIGQNVSALLKQDYPPGQFSILVVDDDSQDRTSAVVRETAGGDERVTLIQNGPLPPGWFGKPRACASAAAEARGEWLCFVDADAVAAPATLRTAMQVAQAERLDLLSLGPQPELLLPAERLILPAGFFLIAFTQDVRSTNDPSLPTASVNGQFMLIRRSTYEAVGGHAAVRQAVAEDSELARLIKARDHRIAIYGTEGLMRVRMYADVRSLCEGTARQAASLLGGSVALLLAAGAAWGLATASIALPVWALYALAAGHGGAGAIIALACSLAGSLALLGTHIGATRYFRIPFWYGLLFPLSYLAGGGVLLYAAWQRGRREARWKGRVYAREPDPADPETAGARPAPHEVSTR